VAISQEVQNWIDAMKAAGASDEWIKSTTDLLSGNEKLHQLHREAVLAQSDYTRQVQALSTLKKQQEAELQKSLDHEKRLTDWQREQTEKGQAAVRSREAAEAKLAAINARLQSLKTDGYLDDKMLEGIDLTGSPPPSTPPPAAPPNGDGSKYVTPELLTQTLGRSARILAQVNDRMSNLRSEHSRIFKDVKDAPTWDGGKVIEFLDDPKNAVPGEAPAAAVERAWKTLYPVNDRLAALDAADREAEITRRADEMFRKRVSQEIEAGRQVAVTPAQPSVMQKIATGKVAKPAGNYALQKQERINKAVAALESART
jgi:hypothetical protein